MENFFVFYPLNSYPFLLIPTQYQDVNLKKKVLMNSLIAFIGETFLSAVKWKRELLNFSLFDLKVILNRIMNATIQLNGPLRNTSIDFDSNISLCEFLWSFAELFLIVTFKETLWRERKGH